MPGRKTSEEQIEGLGCDITEASSPSGPFSDYQNYYQIIKMQLLLCQENILGILTCKKLFSQPQFQSRHVINSAAARHDVEKLLDMK